jgi:hypothetical protein|tara:strand:- start:168 stop:407 length:240 start_codon:yes stop_codon:yes gene_type:complete
MGQKIFGLVLLGLGLSLVYHGFNDEFSIGEQVHSTLRRGSRVISEGVREYGYFDALINRIAPIIIGGIFSFFGYSVLKE